MWNSLTKKLEGIKIMCREEIWCVRMIIIFITKMSFKNFYLVWLHLDLLTKFIQICWVAVTCEVLEHNTTQKKGIFCLGLLETWWMGRPSSDCPTPVVASYGPGEALHSMGGTVYSRDWQTSSSKDQVPNILGFVCHIVSAVAIQLCNCRQKQPQK